MTAVVGILNKRAVAIAADSAVTYSQAGRTSKIFNRANKIFTLSKFHPVGIMIYNGADFMSTPWEIIIKVYRSQLHDTKYGTLKEYQESFIAFLKQQSFFSNPEAQKRSLTTFLITINSTLENEALNQLHVLDLSQEAGRTTLLQQIEVNVDAYISHFSNPANFMQDFNDYTQEEFQSYAEDVFPDVFKFSFTSKNLNLSIPLIEKLKHLYFIFTRNIETTSHYTGLVFVGFGDNEIYASLIPIMVSFSIENRLRYYVNEAMAATISDDNNSAICPFAQVDVIDTILTGVDPVLAEAYQNNFINFLEQYNTLILDVLGNKPELSQLLSKINRQELVERYRDVNQELINKNYIMPLLGAVASLSKEDLSEMAESLIYLTYLKRRITNSEESVGGPVDVAILSKGDGFIWIKRKHYFKPELNNHFFNNYFKI